MERWWVGRPTPAPPVNLPYHQVASQVRVAMSGSMDFYLSVTDSTTPSKTQARWSSHIYMEVQRLSTLTGPYVLIHIMHANSIRDTTHRPVLSSL